MNRMARFAAWLEQACWRAAEALGHERSVRVPAGHAVHWPDCCTGCGGDADDRWWTVSLSRPGPMGLVLGAEPWWRVQRWHAPMCDACWHRARRRLWARRIVPVVVLLTLLLSGLAVAQWLAPLLRPAAVAVNVLAVLGSITAAIVVNLRLGGPVEVMRDGRLVSFEFRSKDVAAAFARCNAADDHEPDQS